MSGGLVQVFASDSDWRTLTNSLQNTDKKNDRLINRRTDTRTDWRTYKQWLTKTLSHTGGHHSQGRTDSNYRMPNKLTDWQIDWHIHIYITDEPTDGTGLNGTNWSNLETWSRFNSLHSLILDPNAMEAEAEGHPLRVLESQIPSIVSALHRQLKEKSIKTRQGAFQLLTELILVIPGKKAFRSESKDKTIF